MNEQNKRRNVMRSRDSEMADAKNTLVAIERDNALRNAVIDAALDCIIMMGSGRTYR